MFESTEQRVCDQSRAIRKNGCLTELDNVMVNIVAVKEGVVS